MTRFPAPSPSDIQRIVELIVETVQPIRIVLFGSGARGELMPGSDLDMLVIVPDGEDELLTAQNLYEEMARRRESFAAVDLLVATPQRFARRRESVGSVFREVAREGRELYAA